MNWISHLNTKQLQNMSNTYIWWKPNLNFGPRSDQLKPSHKIGLILKLYRGWTLTTPFNPRTETHHWKNQNKSHTILRTHGNVPTLSYPLISARGYLGCNSFSISHGSHWPSTTYSVSKCVQLIMYQNPKATKRHNK